MVDVNRLLTVMLVWPMALSAAQAGRSPARPAGTQPTATRPSVPSPRAGRQEPRQGERRAGESGADLDGLIDMLIPEPPTRRDRRRRQSPRHWQDLSPKERRQLRARYDHFKSLPDEEQKQLRELWDQFQQMSPERRERLMRLWHRVQQWLRELQPEERAQFFRLSPRERVIYIGSLAKAGKLRPAPPGASRDVPKELIDRMAPKLTFDEWADLTCVKAPEQWELLRRLARKYQVELPKDLAQTRPERRRRQFARALRLFYETAPEPLRRRVWNLPPEKQVPELMRHYFPALRHFFHELPEPERRELLDLRTRRWQEVQDRLERLFIEHLQRRLAQQPRAQTPSEVRPAESLPEHR